MLFEVYRSQKTFRKTILNICFLYLLALAFFSNTTYASDLELAWQASPTSNVTSYSILIGSESEHYTTEIETGTQLTYTIPTLAAGKDYYIAIVAHDNNGTVSAPSNEIHISTPLQEQAPEVYSISMVDTSTGLNISELSPLQQGAIIDLKDLHTQKLLFQPEVSSNTSSVKFNFSPGVITSIDNTAPFDFSGANTFDQTGWQPEVGEYQITVTGFSESNAHGQSSDPMTVFFSVISTTQKTETTLSNNDWIDTEEVVNSEINTSIVDSNDDQIDDQEKTLDVTDPLAPGSSFKPLSTTVCAEWNGFLGGMFNIMEHTNLSSKTLQIQTTLYHLDGSIASETKFPLTPNNQYDLLVHDMDGWELNNIGKICSSHNGEAGDLDGRMAYYLTNNNRNSQKEFQFAFAMPFSNSIKGTQYVSFNTYQPSFNPLDANNLVANWIQITNQTTESQHGDLEFFGPDGNLIGINTISLPAGARTDVAGHNFGSNLVGLAKWTPKDNNADFTIRNVRYLYDNPKMRNSFATAYQLDGATGSGQIMSVPVSTIDKTSVLELSNTANTPISVNVRITNSEGTEQKQFVIQLAKHATQHLILDQVLKSSAGVAIVKSNVSGSLLATAMHYARTDNGKILYMYGIQAKEAFGTTMHGSYNTYLNQTSKLIITNPTNVPQNVSLSLTKLDGTKMALNANNDKLSVPTNGLLELNLNDFVQANEYGVVNVIMENEASLAAWVLREKPKNYIITTLVK